MLLARGRYQVGSGGCSTHRMLLGTGRYQVGSDGCSPHRMLLGTHSHSAGSHGSCLTRASASAMRDASSVFRPSKTRHVPSEPGPESWGRCRIFAPLRVLRGPQQSDRRSQVVGVTGQPEPGQQMPAGGKAAASFRTPACRIEAL